MKPPLIAALSLILAWPLAASAEEFHHLFNPVPAERMRELSTDRPDKTESAYTVDAGHFQFESDLISLILTRESDGLAQEILFAPVNLKLGLLDQLDAQLILLPLSWQRSPQNAAGIVSDSFSFGDTLIRLKYNLWGNDEGATAFALMPFVKLPTSSAATARWVEGGIVTPFAWDWGGGWGMGTQLQLDLVADETAASASYHPEFSAAFTVGYDLSEQLGAFVELYGGIDPRSPQDVVATFDAGVTYASDPYTQWDLGMYIGLTPAAPLFNPFLGLSKRF